MTESGIQGSEEGPMGSDVGARIEGGVEWPLEGGHVPEPKKWAGELHMGRGGVIGARVGGCGVGPGGIGGAWGSGGGARRRGWCMVSVAGGEVSCGGVAGV